MIKENTKMISVRVSVDCWKELNILRYRKNKNNLVEVVKEILENYTNKIKDKENSNHNEKNI
jgi:hypothetical protein